MRRSLLLCLLCSFGAALFAADDRSIDRWALYVGSNTGGQGRATLRYAEKDARGFASLMSEIGGIQRNDAYLVLSPTLGELTAAFTRIKQERLSHRGSALRREFVFYYSGHSDEDGLLLGNESMSYSKLRSLIAGLEADVDVVILDSCSSGAITRLKGGVKAPPFLVDESSAIKGQVYLTSASEYEAAQESDKLASSFFTYYLLNGLRGAADSSADGRITLNEAYSHAFSETLARTESTQAGPQHPAYNIKLSGSGDLVLTDIRSTATRLRLDASLLGRISIRDSRNNLIAEVQKIQQEVMDLYLPAGSYSLNLMSSGSLKTARIEIPANGIVMVTPGLFMAVKKEGTVSRGEDSSEGESGYHFPLHLSLFSLWPDAQARRILSECSLNLIAGHNYAIDGISFSAFADVIETDLHGFQLSLFYNQVGGTTEGMQLSLFNITQQNMNGFQLGVFNLAANGKGLQLGVANMFQSGRIQFGTVNIASELHGLQFGTVNLGNEMSGLQFGTVNIDNAMHGVQIGTVNIDMEQTGLTCAVVNYATKASGLQLGVVNIAAENDGYPVGLVNVVLKGGQTHLSTWYDEEGYSTIALLHGAKTIYNIYAGGYSQEKQSFNIGFGLGYTKNLGPLYLSLELLATQNYDEKAREAIDRVVNKKDTGDSSAEPCEFAVSRLRVYGGYSLASHLSVFAGISMNSVSSIEADSSVTVRLCPGVFGGVRF